MKIKALLLALLLCLVGTLPAWADAYPSPVQWQSAQSAGAAASVTTSAITTTNGHYFIVCVTGEVAPPNAGSAITDAKSNTWAIALRTTTGDSKIAIYYSTTALGGSSHTFTYTPTSSDFVSITAIEVANMATSSMLSNTNSAVATNTVHSSGNITAGASNELYIGLSGSDHTNNGIGTITRGTQWYLLNTVSASPTTEGFTVGFRFAEAGVTDQFQVTYSANQSEGAMIAGFKVAASGGGSSETAYTFIQ